MTSWRDVLSVACETPDDPWGWLVAADAMEEAGVPLARLLRAGWRPDYSSGGVVGDAYSGYGDAYSGDGGGGGDGAGGGGDGAVDGGVGDGSGGYGDGGYGDGSYGDGGGYGDAKPKRLEASMIQPGLNIVYTPGGWNPLVRVAWCRPRDDGITFDLVNARVMRRFGENAEIAVLAAKGPQHDTILLTPSARPEPQFCVVSRCVPCNPAAWVKEMPKPEGWDDDSMA